MEQVAALSDRIKILKGIAASMHEGAFHTRLFPEIDKILALPDELETASVAEREALTRQIREYEQTFDRLGYSLLDQLMPTIGVSSVFRVVQAADEFRAHLRPFVGRSTRDGKEFDQHQYEVLTRYGLSIGTPPVTDGVRDLISRIVLGEKLSSLYDYVETLAFDPVTVRELFDLFRDLVDSSLHYCTAAEESAFLREAAEYTRFEGGRLLNRVVITESPERVIDLITNHVFDKFTPGAQTAVQVVDGVDRIDESLVNRLQAEPNQVFVVRVTRIPHWLFLNPREESVWRSVLGRIVFIDTSEQSRKSNTTLVYTLFPHVARTLRNVQTGFGGRPANTQLQLRRLLESFSPPILARLGIELERQIAAIEEEGITQLSVETIRGQDWRRDSLFDFLTLIKVRRLTGFLEQVASRDDEARRALGAELREKVTSSWMRYFYSGMPLESYPATVIPGGGRGALTLVGELHRQQVRERLEAFSKDVLPACRKRLEALKQTLQIPGSSTDEIQAAIKQSQLKSLSPVQWRGEGQAMSLRRHLARSVLYRAVDTARMVTRKTQEGVERAVYGNLTGGVSARVKKTMSDAGFGALHGRFEDLFNEQVQRYDRRVRNYLLPVQEAIRAVRKATDDLKGGLDPVAVGEIEAILKRIEQKGFYPILILPELAWTYQDVFPEKYFPARSTMRIPLDDRQEVEPLALLEWIESQRYLLRKFPEVFELLCQSMLLLINSPHNPTGIVYRQETILRLLHIASEYGITVVDDNSYHKLISRDHKAREGEDCVAQIYEKHRNHFSRPVCILTVGATTKGLQGSGDRTGFLHSNDPEVVRYAEQRASDPHLMSLYLTQLKLEHGLAVKRWTRKLEQLAAEILDPTDAGQPARRLRDLLEAEYANIREEDFPVALFETLLEGYETLLRLEQRGAALTDLSRAISTLVKQVKLLRPERTLRADVERRFEAVRAARRKVMPDAEEIAPEGAFYYCLRLCEARNDRGVQTFLEALCRHRKVDVTYAGRGFVRLSLGGRIAGDDSSYERFGRVVEIYLGVLLRYWKKFEAEGRRTAALEAMFSTKDESLLDGVLKDLSGLLELHPPKNGQPAGNPITPDERGIVYCIEEGRSAADKVFIRHSPCGTVDELLKSRPFRVVYRRLLRKVYHRYPALADMGFEQVDNQYGPFSCQTAYHDRQLIDPLFRKLMREMYEAWHGDNTVKVLAAGLEAGDYGEKVAALSGFNRKINELINDLMRAFEVPDEVVSSGATFDIGYEVLRDIQPNITLPFYLRQLVASCDFAGATTPLNPSPNCVTGAAKRVADSAYGFIRRDSETGEHGNPPLAHFARRLERFATAARLEAYVCKAVQTGPFKMLLVIHRACFHLLSDELRLFPQIEDVQLRDNLNALAWDGALLFGIPVKTLGESYRSGYVLDHRTDGSILPLSWIAREDATDYVGFLKKSLLTIHNELAKRMGGLPVHGAMITITFKNGLRKTLVFSADSGTGKSETITAMMEQIIGGIGPAVELRRIDILASDMLSLWCGEDDQIYAFGTETGDFLRLNDITDGWKAHFGDLLKRGARSNLTHPKNARVTIPGICDLRKVLAPTRVNGFFYINNYEAPRGSSVEVSEDPHQVLKHTLVRGLRKNKGTSGDQPSLRAGLEFAEKPELVVRFRHAIDELLDWQPRVEDGVARTCLVFRDGSNDVFAARSLVTSAFRGRHFEHDGHRESIARLEFDVLKNLFRVVCESSYQTVLDRQVYDQLYEPLTSTFCGNPFVDPEGMDEALQRFASTMWKARVHTGVIRTQLARKGSEFSGPAKAARDIVTFLMEDEEVNARFQRNKDKVHQAMQRTYGGILVEGGNLPVELEGHNLLRLEAHESTHVAFVDARGGHFTLSTPFYRFDPSRGSVRGTFAPAIVLPETLVVVGALCNNADYQRDFEGLEVDLSRYESIRHWNDIHELTYQILLVHGVICLGSSETEVARFPIEVRKARHVADVLAASRGGRGTVRGR